MFSVNKNNIWPIWTTSQLASLWYLPYFSRVLFSYALFRLGSKDTCFSALSFASTISVRFREKSWISPNSQRQGPKFRKLQEAIWLTVIKEIFKFPPHFVPFFQVNYLYELSWCYPKYPTQKWYIWPNFQTSKKRLSKLQEANLWLTVINEIFKFPKRLDTFWQINYLYELFPGYPNYPTQKWNIWASFQTPTTRFRK